MRVQEIMAKGRGRRYILVQANGEPVMEVSRYLKHLDNIGKSANTQCTYCYALKLYLEFLEQRAISFKNAGVAELSDFLGWLQYPECDPLSSTVPKPGRCAKTANLTLSVVCGFYAHLYRCGQLPYDLNDSLKRVVINGRHRYKDFLYHVTRQHPQLQSYLKVKESVKRVRALSKAEVQTIYDAAGNIRDRFLIQLLFETGIRIGEALSLWVSDFHCNHDAGPRIRLTARGEPENGARLKSGERDIHVSQDLMNLFDDYLYSVLDELNAESNFVFVKLKGKHKGLPMTYADVGAVFRSISSKTGLQVSPHQLRHTHATLLYAQTKDIKFLQERLGHRQIQTTIAIYVHPSEEDIRHSWEEAQKLFKLKGGAK